MKLDINAVVLELLESEGFDVGLDEFDDEMILFGWHDNVFVWFDDGNILTRIGKSNKSSVGNRIVFDVSDPDTFKKLVKYLDGIGCKRW